MVEPWLCHLRHVSGRIVKLWSSRSLPSLMSLKATCAVIIFAIEAGGMRRLLSRS